KVRLLSEIPSKIDLRSLEVKTVQGRIVRNYCLQIVNRERRITLLPNDGVRHKFQQHLFSALQVECRPDLILLVQHEKDLERRARHTVCRENLNFLRIMIKAICDYIIVTVPTIELE